MILWRFKNNQNLLDSFNNILIDENKERVYRHPFCYIKCNLMFNGNDIRLMPVIVKPHDLSAAGMATIKNYSILSAPSEKKLEKMLDGKSVLKLNDKRPLIIGISRETYDRIQREKDNLMRELLKEIVKENREFGLKNELEFANAIDDAFSELDNIYPESHTEIKDFPNGCDENLDFSINDGPKNCDDYDEVLFGDRNGDWNVDALDREY